MPDSKNSPGAPDPELSEPEDLTEQEQEDLTAAEDEAETVAYSGQDFDINGLVRRLKNDDILVPTFGHDDERIEAAGFQRAFVWRRPQMDRFVESILLGYPIPGIFLVRQSDKRYLVLDGQQRLTTLRYFVEDLFAGREFALRNVSERFRGLKYKTLPEDLRRTFDDTFIQATIVVSDGSPSALESIYQIFERLNSGGTQLTPHEIRVALFAGPLVDFCESLNRTEHWRALYGRRSPRLRDQELVLRSIALFHNSEAYKRPLKTFLNDFVSAHRSGADLPLDRTRSLFEGSNRLIAADSGHESFRLRGPQVNAALAEVLIVGLMKRLDLDPPVPTPTVVKNAIESIKANPSIHESLTRSTADEEQLKTRLAIAVKAFESI